MVSALPPDSLWPRDSPSAPCSSVPSSRGGTSHTDSPPPPPQLPQAPGGHMRSYLRRRLWAVEASHQWPTVGVQTPLGSDRRAASAGGGDPGRPRVSGSNVVSLGLVEGVWGVVGDLSLAWTWTSCQSSWMQGLGSESRSLARGSILVPGSPPGRPLQAEGEEGGREGVGWGPFFHPRGCSPLPCEWGHLLHKNTGTLDLAWKHLRGQTDHLRPAPGLGRPDRGQLI